MRCMVNLVGKICWILTLREAAYLADDLNPVLGLDNPCRSSMTRGELKRGEFEDVETGEEASYLATKISDRSRGPHADCSEDNFLGQHFRLAKPQAKRCVI